MKPKNWPAIVFWIAICAISVTCIITDGYVAMKKLEPKACVCQPSTTSCVQLGGKK